EFFPLVTAPEREEAGDLSPLLGGTHMSSRQLIYWVKLAAVAGLIALGAGPFADRAHAQRNAFFGNQVGGVVVDTEGILRSANVDELNQLAKARAEQLKRVPEDFHAAAPLRKVSLRRLQEEFAARKAKGQTPLFTDEMEYLAGLTRIRYV